LADFRYGIHTALYKAPHILTSTPITSGTPITVSAGGTTYSESISEIRQPSVTSKMPPVVEGGVTTTTAGAGERSTKM